MPRNFIRREREAPAAPPALPKGEPNRDLIARIEAYTAPPAESAPRADRARFLRSRNPALLRTGL